MNEQRIRTIMTAVILILVVAATVTWWRGKLIPVPPEDKLTQRQLDSTSQVIRGLLQQNKAATLVIDSLKHKSDSMELQYLRDKESHKEITKPFEVQKEKVKTLPANSNLNILKDHLQ